MVLCIPCFRAHATICRAVGPSFTLPSPTSPNKRTPASASERKSSSTIPCSITGAPAKTFTPLGRSAANARCAVIAIAFTPTTSFGRPGMCTSPAEIIVVTPPCRQLSIQPIWFWRGVQSPATGCTWLSISPGASVVPLASMIRVAPSASTSFSLPTAVIFPSTAITVSASRIGFCRSPLSSRPILRITSRACGLVWAVSSFLLALAIRSTSLQLENLPGSSLPANHVGRQCYKLPSATAAGGPGMLSRNIVFWEVDTQKDFMLPGGKLYVPGAERLLPNIRRLTDAARHERIFLVSHGCFHTKDDPEFATFPPHCVKGTAGAGFVPEALTEKVVTVPNEPTATLPADFSQYQQILLEKQTLDIFASQHAEELVERLGHEAEFIVFGVVTEFCVRFAAKGLLERGRSVSVVQDAIETLDSQDGKRAVTELQALGAIFITTDQALTLLNHPK